MNVCFPVLEMNGMDSQIYDHFGSAKNFAMVDTDTQTVSVLENTDNVIHAQGGCNPLAPFQGVNVDAVIVGGIGAGALSKLQKTGVRVFQAQKYTLKENLALLQRNELPEFRMQHTCGGGNGGCHHH